jgi:ParB family chromosome partitioning protein
VERVVSASRKETPRKKEQLRQDPNVRAAVERLERALGTKVRIVEKGQRGRIEIEFYSSEELQRLYEYLVRSEDH